MPRAKPNEAMVSTGWSAIAAVAPAQLVAELGGRQVGGVEHAVGGVAQRRGQLALAGDAVLGGRSGASGWRRRVSS